MNGVLKKLGLGLALGATALTAAAPAEAQRWGRGWGGYYHRDRGGDAVAGALLGGIASPVGAVAGGFAVGVLENLLGAYVVGNDLKLTCIMLLIIAMLVLRPAGIFGKTAQVRV